MLISVSRGRLDHNARLDAATKVDTAHMSISQPVSEVQSTSDAVLAPSYQTVYEIRVADVDTAGLVILPEEPVALSPSANNCADISKPWRAFAFAGSNFYPVIHLPFADSMKETL